MADNKQIRRAVTAAEHKQQAFIQIEILFGKHDTLLTRARRINERLLLTNCKDCRLKLEIRRSRINREIDKVTGQMHEYVRKVNSKPARKNDYWMQGYEKTFRVDAGFTDIGSD
jgi:hypothetical protein